MVRPLRLEFPGALYHVTARGNARENIYLCDEDRIRFLKFLEEEVRQQGWILYAYCLMDNHYHLLFETPLPNLCKGMQRFNGRYTQYFNRKHQRVGHVFQGRYKSILVEKESHLLELCRYMVLNPVRAKMVATPGDWRWSSYEETCAPPTHYSWLSVVAVQSQFAESVDEAIKFYREFVMYGMASDSPWENLRGQVYLGGESFSQALQKKLSEKKLGRDICFDQQHLDRPKADDVCLAVMEAYDLSRECVLDRRNKEAFRICIYLLRRCCNMPLNDVSLLAGISLGRISQIQREVASGGINSPVISKLKKKFEV